MEQEGTYSFTMELPTIRAIHSLIKQGIRRNVVVLCNGRHCKSGLDHLSGSTTYLVGPICAFPDAFGPGTNVCVHWRCTSKEKDGRGKEREAGGAEHSQRSVDKQIFLGPVVMQTHYKRNQRGVENLLVASNNRVIYDPVGSSRRSTNCQGSRPGAWWRVPGDG